MAETTIVTETILEVKTLDAVKNVNDLKNNIKLLKEALKDENAELKDNQKVLEELNQNQQALKTIMYGSKQPIEAITKAVTDNRKSYNSLVQEMARLKATMPRCGTSGTTPLRTHRRASTA